jgi:hypothetical protein
MIFRLLFDLNVVLRFINYQLFRIHWTMLNFGYNLIIFHLIYFIEFI